MDQCSIALPSNEFLTEYEEWLAIQNGAAAKRRLQFDATPRYITTGRDLAEYVRAGPALGWAAALMLATPGGGTDQRYSGMYPVRSPCERGEASDGQRPVRAGAGGGKRVVPTHARCDGDHRRCPSVNAATAPVRFFNRRPLECLFVGGPAQHAGATVDAIGDFLIFLLGAAAGYICRDYISRVRHQRSRVRHAQREEERLNALATSIDLPAFLSRRPDA